MEHNRNATLTVGTDSTKVSEKVQYPQVVRKLISITNTSTGGQIITLAFGQEAKAGQGTVLYPAGSWCESIDAAYIPSQEEINAISSVAGGTLAIQERLVS